MERDCRLVSPMIRSLRRGGLGKRPAADTQCARCEAAACGRADAVRLAHHRTDRTDEPGGGGPRPKHVVNTGKTPVLEGDEWRKLLASIPTTTLRDLRDRALPRPCALTSMRPASPRIARDGCSA